MNKHIFIIILIINSFQLFSQKKTDANIVGHVISGGEHVPFATINLKGTTIGTNTDETGHYRLVNIPVGTFILRAQCIGHKPSEKEIEIKEGTTQEVNFELEKDVLGIEEIVVTADRTEMKRKESITIVNTLSPKLFSLSQSVTLLEGLTFSPGIRIENNCQNCGYTQVRINGMEGPYSQILIDSRPIFSHLAGVYGLELIPSNIIDRIEVIRGGASAMYGSNAIAGVINIILKEPSTNLYEVGFNSALTGIGLKNSGSVAPDFSLNVNTSVVSSDGKTSMALSGFTRERQMFDANNDGFSEIAQLINQTIGARIFHRIGLRDRFDFNFFNIKEERGGGNRLEYPLHERDISEAVRHNVKTADIKYEKYFRDYDLLSLFVSSEHITRDSYYGANRSLKAYGKTYDLVYNIGIQYKTFIRNNSVIFGVEKTVDNLKDKKLGYPDYSNALIVNDSIISVPHVPNTVVSDQTSSISGLFFQYDLKAARFKMGIGARFDHYRITDRTKTNEAKNGNVLSPRISLMYQILESLQARLSYSQGYRAPQIFDEDLHIETSGARQVINVNDPKLKQETSHSIMASLDFNRVIGAITTSFLVEGFYTKLTNPFFNEIGVPDENGKVIYLRKNAENGALVKGVNMELKMKLFKDFLLSSGFTIQASLYDEKQQFDTRKFFRTPSNYGYFNIDWDIIRSLRFSSTSTYTGRMLVPYFGPLTDPDIGELRLSDPFFDLGIKISYNIKLNGSIMQIFTGMKNIFNSYQSDFDRGINRDPSYIYGTVSPRTLYFGIRLGNKIE
mgnify:CR=1 FL=1